MKTQACPSGQEARRARNLGEAEALAARAYHRRLTADMELMDLVAEVERYRLYESSGYESTESWLSAFLGMGFTRTCEYVRIAVALGELPVLRQAYISGEVSYDHLRALVQVAGPDSESDLLDACRGQSVSDTFHLVERIKQVSAEDSQEARRQRWLETSWDLESRMLLLNACLPEEAGAKVERAIDALAKKIPGDPGEQFTPMGAKRADALTQMAEAVITAHPSKASVVVHVDAEALASGRGTAEILDGPVISASTARRLACDASLVWELELPHGGHLQLGRSTATVTNTKRRQIHRRDRRCRVPGCRRRKLIEVHHIHHRSLGGSHELSNTVSFCGVHHRWVHEGGYVIRGTPPNIWLEHPSLPPVRVGPPKARSPAKPPPLFSLPALAPT